MRRLTGPLLGVGRGLWAALLPAPERDRFARNHEIDVARWSFGLGLIQMVGGALLFMYGGLAFMLGASVTPSMALLENWFPGLSTTHFQGVMMLNWFAWFLHPLSWPLAYATLIGVLRCVAFAATREAVGEPLVWAGLRLAQRFSATRAERRHQRRLGPERPDRLLQDPGADLVVLSCREKPGWNEVATIEIEGRYYRVSSIEIRGDGEWEALAYLLREQEPGMLVRRLIAYRKPRPRQLTR